MVNPFAAGGKYPSEMTPQELEEFEAKWVAEHPPKPTVQNLWERTLAADIKIPSASEFTEYIDKWNA